MNKDNQTETYQQDLDNKLSGIMSSVDLVAAQSILFHAFRYTPADEMTEADRNAFLDIIELVGSMQRVQQSKTIYNCTLKTA